MRYTILERKLFRNMIHSGCSHGIVQNALNEHRDSLGKPYREFPEGSYKIVKNYLKNASESDLEDYLKGITPRSFG